MSTTASATDVSQSRKALQFVGNATGPLALLAFGIALWYYQANENIFSFGAWGALDALTGVALLATGKEEDRLASRLPLAYGFIAFFVVMMIYQNGMWKWGLAENVCLIGTFIALIGWKLSGPLFAVVAFNAAMGIASIPILIGDYHNPQTWTWWLWVGSLTSATIGLYLARPLRLSNIGKWLFVAVSEIVTILMLYCLFRPYFF
jgi:hypothetical protein